MKPDDPAARPLPAPPRRGDAPEATDATNARDAHDARDAASAASAADIADTADTADTVQQLAERLRAHGWRMATAESCTGGLVAGACTELAGSSDWFERGWVTYSNAAKADDLQVAQALIAQHGAVSQAVARAMAEGALRRAACQAAVSVTGIAGPGGAVPGKPVGTVWIAWAVRVDAGPPAVSARVVHLVGDRAAVRRQTVALALAGLLERLPVA